MTRKYKKDEFTEITEAKRLNEPFTITRCPFCKEIISEKYNYCVYCGKKIKGKKLIKEIIK